MSESDDEISTPCASSDVAIVIAVQTRVAELERVLRSLDSLTQKASEVIVVASGRHDPSIPQIAHSHGARILVERQGGLNRARNLGARSSRAEIVAFLDDDSMPHPGWLSAIAGEFSDHSVVAVAGKVRPDKTVLSSVPSESDWFLDLSISGGDEKRILDRSTVGWLEMVLFGGVGIGTNLAIRRSVYDWWPGFDERIGAGTLIHGGEEALAFLNFVEAGYKVVYVPDGLVVHPTSLPATSHMISRYRDALAARTAYITLLLTEIEQHRLAVFRYVFQSLIGVSRPWRTHTEQRAAVPVTALERFIAYLSGPVLYLRTRIRERISQR